MEGEPQPMETDRPTPARPMMSELPEPIDFQILLSEPVTKGWILEWVSHMSYGAVYKSKKSLPKSDFFSAEQLFSRCRHGVLETFDPKEREICDKFIPFDGNYRNKKGRYSVIEACYYVVMLLHLKETYTVEMIADDPAKASIPCGRWRESVEKSLDGLFTALSRTVSKEEIEKAEVTRYAAQQVLKKIFMGISEHYENRKLEKERSALSELLQKLSERSLEKRIRLTNKMLVLVDKEIMESALRGSCR